MFHGSTVSVAAPLVGIGRKNLDFGKGFYVTDLKEQAISWASRPLNAGRPQLLNVYEFDKAGVLNEGFRYKQFTAYDMEWLEFVVACREGKDETNYDIVEGGVANDRVVDTVNLYMALLKHPAVILGISLQVFQGLFEQPFLEGFYLFRAFEFYILLHPLERHVVEPGDKLREPVLGFFCILFRVHTKAVTAFSVLDIVMRHVFGA